MTPEVNRGIGYTVQRIGNDVRVLLPYLDPMDPVMARFKQPSVTFPADACSEGQPFSGMTDSEIVGWVRGNIAGEPNAESGTQFRESGNIAA